MHPEQIPIFIIIKFQNIQDKEKIKTKKNFREEKENIQRFRKGTPEAHKPGRNIIIILRKNNFQISFGYFSNFHGLPNPTQSNLQPASNPKQIQ